MSAHALRRHSVIRPHAVVAHGDPTRALTWAAHLAWIGYGLWLPVMHAVALSIYDILGIEPGSGDLTGSGFIGCAANLALLVVLALPLWIGAALAAAALRRGADGPAWAALVLNLGLGVALIVFGFLVPC